jgi:hypothetical protein
MNQWWANVNTVMNLQVPYTYLVGSSKNMTGGFVNNSRPIDSLFFSPPDKLATGEFITFSSPRRFSISLTCHNNCMFLRKLCFKFYTT